MKRNIWVIIAFLTLILVAFTGCMDEKSKFIGTWESEGGGTTLDFDEDNTVSITGEGPLGNVELTGNFEYSVGENEITFSSGSIGITLNYNFPESDELVLSNDQGDSVTFMKKY